MTCSTRYLTATAAARLCSALERGEFGSPLATLRTPPASAESRRRAGLRWTVAVPASRPAGGTRPAWCVPPQVEPVAAAQPRRPSGLAPRLAPRLAPGARAGGIPTAGHAVSYSSCPVPPDGSSPAAAAPPPANQPVPTWAAAARKCRSARWHLGPRADAAAL